MSKLMLMLWPLATLLIFVLNLLSMFLFYDTGGNGDVFELEIGPEGWTFPAVWGTIYLWYGFNRECRTLSHSINTNSDVNELLRRDSTASAVDIISS